MTRYPVPWRAVFGIWRNVASGTRADLHRFCHGFVDAMQPPSSVEGLHRLPASPRFVLVANHYQRPGLWIAHPATALTLAMAAHYRLEEAAVRWVVTANWPPWRVGPIVIPSPGDVLLPRVAHALWCHAVPFAGTDPRRTARSLRALLRAADSLQCPIGLFPEGVAGTATNLSEPLPGVDRLLPLLAKRGFPVVPVGIAEQGRLVLRIGNTIPAGEILAATDAAVLAMNRIRALLPARQACTSAPQACTML